MPLVNQHMPPQQKNLYIYGGTALALAVAAYFYTKQGRVKDDANTAAHNANIAAQDARQKTATAFSK